MLPNAVKAEDFFSALYQGVERGFIEIRSIPKEGAPTAKFFKWPDERSAAADYCRSLSGKVHVYFGVGLRGVGKKPANSPKKGQPGYFAIGGKDNVSAVTAVYADLDFKDIPEEKLRAMLQAFPLKPSIVVRSGGGIYPFWLLDSPISSTYDLERLEAVNLAILEHFGAQRGTQDCSRILRVPETLNIKDKYPDPKPVCSVSYFQPKTRYTLEQFVTLKLESFTSLSRPAGGGPAAAPAASAAPATAPPPALNGSPEPAPPSGTVTRRPPSIDLPADVVEKIGEEFGGIWLDHHRHFMALRVAGMLAYAGVSEKCAIDIVTIASNVAGGDTQKRLIDVRDTYHKFVSGGEVAGGPALEKMILAEFPVAMRATAKRTLDQIRRLLPRADEKKGRKVTPPDFEIVKRVKITSDPTEYKVYIRKNGSSDVKVVRCGHKEFFTYFLFRPLFTEVTDEFIAPLVQWQWEQLLEEARVAGKFETQAAAVEATVDGVIEHALDVLIEDKKEKPDVGELKAAAGYDQDGVFFSLSALKAQLIEQKVTKIPDQAITGFLRSRGWSDERRRYGGKNPRLWRLHKNGNGSHIPKDGLFQEPISPEKTPL